MRNFWMLALLGITLFFSCKKKKKEPENNFISVLSLIRSQVAHVDTSLYPIMRIEIIDSLHSDTVFIPREQFADAANDFLDIPDLADKKIAPRYKEEKLYDETIGRFIISYTPVDPAKESIQKQELLVDPLAPSDKNVTNIIINRSMSNRDSAVQKIMLWQLDKYFQVTTIRQLPGQPENINIIKVSWNEDKFQ